MTIAWIFRRTRREASRHKHGLLGLVGAFGVLAGLLAAAVFGTRTAAALTPLIAHDVHVIAYLRDDATASRIAAIAETLGRLPGIRSVTPVDSAEALARLRAEVESMGSATTLLEGIEEGFLPRSLEVALLPSDDLPARAADLAARLRKLTGIAEVDAMEGSVSPLAAWVKLARWIGLAMFVLATIAGFAGLLWSVGKARDQRREQTEALWLLGESPGGIRLPTGILGAAAALVGCLLGVGAASAIFRAVVGSLPSFGGLAPVVRPLGPAELFVGLSTALVAGWIVGRLATPLPFTTGAR